jgi:hypothetical protein
VESHSNNIVAQMKMRRAEFDHHQKVENLTKQNAKILQKIVEARQINVKARGQFVASIKQEEIRSRSVRDALQRANARRATELALENQRFAVKLFTQKPTYQVLTYEKQHKKQQERVQMLSKFTRYFPIFILTVVECL